MGFRRLAGAGLCRPAVRCTNRAKLNLARAQLPFSSTASRPAPNIGYRDYSQSCWKCDHRLRCPVAFCPGCETIQPPNSPHNEFQILELPESFDLSSDQIVAQYRSLAKLTHPDKYEQKSEQEKEISFKFSSNLNTAYRTLKDPVLRARALLEVRGVVFDDGDKMADFDFLEKIMETREKIQTGNKNVIGQVQGETVQELIHCQDAFRNKLSMNDLMAAKETVIKMIYWSRILSTICKDS